MNPRHPEERPTKRPSAGVIACAVLLVLLPLAVYVPAYNAGFYSDDESHIVKNERLRTARGLGEIWTDFRGTDNLYYPLTFTTYWIDYHLWGMNPVGFHAANIILHAMNSLLVWLVFRRLGIPGAWFAAAIFAVHPVHVESVAWATERRNTLSGFFYLLSMLAYLRFRPPQSPARGTTDGGARPEASGAAVEHGDQVRRPAAYFLALLFFAAALLSKTVTLTLPAAMLVVIWWKQGRLTRRDWLPLVPFFVLGIGLSLWTAGLEKTLVGRGGPGWGVYTASDRVLIAGRAVWFYLGKVICPLNLSFVYPQWTTGGGWTPYLYPIGVLALVGTLFALRRHIGRAPAASLLFFIGTLFPVLGFVNYFYMMLSFVADRFSYLPSLGIIALLTGCAAAGYRKTRPRIRTLVVISGVLLLAALAAATWRRASCFKSAEILYSDVLAKYPDSWVGHYSLGVVLAAQSHTEEALPHLETAVRLKPNFPSIRGYLGVVYSQLGRTDEALRSFQEGLDQNPNDVEIRTNLGVALVNAGRYDDAIEEYAKALAVRPDYAPAQRNLSRIVLYRIDSLIQAGDAAGAAEFARGARSLAVEVGATDLADEIDRRVRRLPAVTR